MSYRSLAAALVVVCAVSAHSAIKTEEVEYAHDGVVLQGYFAYDDAVKGKRPAVMVVHEWWGHGPYGRRRAEQLAQLGYLAFANDMYGKGVYAKTHEEATFKSQPFRADRALMRGRALAGLEAMKKHRLADAAKAGAVGYCFGGTAVLELARMNAPVKAVVSFHAGLDTPNPEKTANVKPKILALTGGDDPWTIKGVPDFEAEMRRAGADWQLVTYGGAVHSFTVKEAGNDPSKGMAYNETVDKRSWTAMKLFLQEALSK